MPSLTRILEVANALQLRDRLTRREALSRALTYAAHDNALSPSPTHAEDAPMPLKILLPAAMSLDALLPHDREPTTEEIREAWKQCVEESSLYRISERDGIATDAPESEGPAGQ